MTQTVLVTGGAGYVGSHVCKALARSGYCPVVVDNLTRGHASAAKWGPLAVHDLEDVKALRALLERYQVCAIVHMAALAYVGESTRIPETYFRNNVIGTLLFLEAVLDAQVEHFVFSSTCAVYGKAGDLPITEAHALEPLSPYGESKLFIEKVLQSYQATHRLNWASLRYFNAAGADLDGELGEDHDPETHLIPSAMQALSGRRAFIEIHGTDYPTPDGTAVRDYVHVADLADAHVRALEHLMRGGRSGAFNLGTGHGHSVRQVIDAVARVCRRPVPVVAGPRRPGDSPVLVADATKAATVLGWRARCSELDTILESAWR